MNKLKMGYISIVMILIIGLIIMPLSAVSLNNTLAVDQGDVDGNGGTADYNSFTPAAKIAYDALVLRGIDVVNITDTRTFEGMINYFNSYGLTAIAVNTTKDQLQRGDIVQIKNSDSAFLVYLGKDANGNILLENVHQQLQCNPTNFDLLFTGNAILINHQSSGLSSIKAAEIDDGIVHDETTQTSPMIVGASTVTSSGSSWNTAYTRQDFRDRAKNLVSGKTSNYDKVNAIFKYVRDVYDYQYYFGSTHGVNRVVSEKKEIVVN